MAAPEADLVCYITVRDACRRLHMRAEDGREWLRARGLIVRVAVTGRKHQAQRVSLSALAKAMEAPVEAATRARTRRRRLTEAEEEAAWDALHPRHMKAQGAA